MMKKIKRWEAVDIALALVKAVELEEDKLGGPLLRWDDNTFLVTPGIISYLVKITKY